MRMRSFYVVIVLLVGLFSLNSNVVSAETISDVDEKIRQLEKKKNEVNSKSNELNKNKKEVNQKMDTNKAEQSSVQAKINGIEEKLVATRADIQTVTANITSTEKEIEELQSEIKQLHNEIEELERRIEERNELLKERLRSIQESGGKSQFISVLLGAQNFTDFIVRSSAVNTIMDQDRNIMEEHEQDQLALERKKEEVETKKASVELKKIELEGQRSKLEGLKVQLDDQKAEQSKLKKELQAEYAEMEEYQLTLEEEQQIFNAEAAAIEKLKSMAESEKNKIIEQQKREEQERIRAEKARAAENKKENQTKTQTGNTNTGNTTTSTYTPSSQSGGLLLKPVPYAINSAYRSADRPNHKGVDMAAPSGTAVAAAASGYVTKVVTGCGVGEQWHRCGGGFGNVVYITHLIEGRTVTTVYAHLSSVNVSNGQTVSRGQIIGGVGNTGHSFGNHLHFEVHEGGFNGSASARNPASYF